MHAEGLPSEYKVNVILTSGKPAVGLSFAGGFIAPGLSGEGYDMFYPNFTWPPLAAEIAASNTGTYKPPQFDSCMSHLDKTGFIHSHLLGGCNKGGDLDYASKQGEICKLTDICHTEVKEYALKKFSASRGRQPVGIAIDGHIIWGPYKEDGNLYTGCETDMCNGLYINGYYSYALTTWLPYNIGCFGGATLVKGISP